MGRERERETRHATWVCWQRELWVGTTPAGPAVSFQGVQREMRASPLPSLDGHFTEHLLWVGPP